MAGSEKEKATKSDEPVIDASRLVESMTGLAASRPTCARYHAAVDDLLRRRCAEKVNALPHLDKPHSGCKCTGKADDAPFMADLIVLIDTSGSMSDEAAMVSAAAAAAVEGAKARCKVDLRIHYMGVEGVWPGTVFTTDYLAYLKGILNPDPAFETDNPTGGYTGEEGANAIEDLSKYFDWRRDACRAIFYISDEELDSISPLGDTANEALQVSKAVAAAKANDVTVFAHHITNQHRGPAVVQNYNDLCNQTGGRAYFSDSASRTEYEEMLGEAICKSCGLPRCGEVETPKLEPCISVSWGDSRCDCFETDDTEIVCITACNCYSNVTISNLVIEAVLITGPGGTPVPLLPDGTPSVQMVPLGPVCFGSVPPCRDDVAGCISREFVIRTRGARPGSYEVHLFGICYDVVFHYDMRDSFKLELCKD